VIGGMKVSGSPACRTPPSIEERAQPILAGAEGLIDKVGLGPHAVGQHEHEEYVGERRPSYITRIISFLLILSAVHVVTAVAISGEKSGWLSLFKFDHVTILTNAAHLRR
jgi:hypothetical protein